MPEISLTGDQMLAVLERVAAEGPIPASAVAQACGINRTVAYRLLATLTQRSYLRRTKAGYVLGPTVSRLGRLVDNELRDAAMPVMRTLSAETGETVVLHIIDKDQAVVLTQVIGMQHLVRVEHPIGSKHPLCKGASGWAILAFQDRPEIARVFAAHGEPATGWDRIEQIRSEGFAISHDELQQGVHGLSAPVTDGNGQCEASLTVLVPGTRAQGLAKYREQLLGASAHISASLREGLSAEG